MPFEVKKAVVFENQAQFNPLEFIDFLAADLTIYEKTYAIHIEDNTVFTNGGKIKANHVVFACHYPFVNYPGFYFIRMYQERSYVIAAESDFLLNGMYLGIDDNGLSFRSYHNMLLIGGEKHRAGVNNENKAFDLLWESAKNLFPGCREITRWSAQDCITLDGIPYIGRFSEKRPNWFVATGFGKWGMTSSMVASDIISDLICNHENPCEDIFSPKRFSLKACKSKIYSNSKEIIKGYTKGLFQFPKTEEDDIPNDTVGIIKYNNQKAGAYRDSHGRIYIVSLKCPHLGCTLTWNETTKTWDCPCHGSRYDYKGHLLDNPAQSISIRLN